MSDYSSFQSSIDRVLRLKLEDLPTEQELMSGWDKSLKVPAVSIICNTYNHREYLDCAIKGFLMQKTTFPFEVILHDDASNDGTADIVLSYARRYPKIIKAILQTENQYSKGEKPTLLSFPHTRADLIAICEGDDFWIDDYKLTRQKDAMEESHNVNLCVHKAAKVDLSCQVISLIPDNECRNLISPSEVIRGGGGWSATSSIMVRREVIEQFSANFKSAPVGDLFIQSLGGVKGGAAFVKEVGSVYRVGVPGGWSRTIGQGERILQHHDRMQESLDVLGALPDFSCFSKEVRVLKSRCSYNSAIVLFKSGNHRKFSEMIFDSFRYKPFLNLKQFLYFLIGIPFLVFR